MDHFAHVYVFPPVEAVRRVVSASTVKVLRRDRRVAVPVQPTAFFSYAEGSLFESGIAEVTVHTGIGSVRVHVLQGTNHTVIITVQANLRLDIVSSRLKIVIATDEDIRISRTVTSVQRCHTTAVLLENNLGQVQLTFRNVAVKHSFAVVNIAVEDHDNLEVLLGLGGKRIQRVVQNICTTARGDDNRSLVTVGSRHNFPSGLSERISVGNDL